MAKTALVKWGNSSAVRIPKRVLERAQLREGDPVEFDVEGQGVIVMRAAKPIPELDELVAGITSKNRHGEQDWGKPKGKEVW